MLKLLLAIGTANASIEATATSSYCWFANLHCKVIQVLLQVATFPVSKLLLAIGHLLPPSVGPHAGLRPGWSGLPPIPRQNCPICPLPTPSYSSYSCSERPSQHFSTFFSWTLWEVVTDQICALLQKCKTATLVSIDSYCHFVEKAWVPLTGFTISVLFAPACLFLLLFALYWECLRLSNARDISWERSTLRGNSTWHKNTSRYNNEDASQGGWHQNGLKRRILI